MVEAVRHGSSLRATARRFGVGLGTVQRWVTRAGNVRLDRVDWGDRPDRPHRTTRTDPEVEALVLLVRRELRETSVLGEYGARAIHADLRDRPGIGEPVPSVRTIGRILERHGALDHRRRRSAPPPPAGWYLPDVRDWKEELDSFDTIEGLRLRAGPELTVLTGISLHGGRADAWPAVSVTVSFVIDALLGRWATAGLPGYAQFDNDGRFAGSSGTEDAIGEVIRACLALGVTPVFAPPRESGFQAAIESFNGLWQAKLWTRHSQGTLDELRAHSARYIAASWLRRAPRIDAAPARRLLPAGIDLDRVPTGRLVYLRRTTDAGNVMILGHQVHVDRLWAHRLVRAEVDLDEGRLRFFALRRRAPTEQPLLREIGYHAPDRWSR
jgi:transposase-like protein